MLAEFEKVKVDVLEEEFQRKFQSFKKDNNRVNKDAYSMARHGKWTSGLTSRYLAKKRITLARDNRRKQSSNERKKFAIYEKSEELRTMDPMN